MTINVLHVISSLKLGGAQTCIKAFVPALPREIQSFIYPLRSRDIDIPIPAETIRNNLANYDPRKISHFLRTCRRFDIHIIHAHLEKSILLSLATKPLHRLPVVVHEHGPICEQGRDHAFYRFCLRHSYRRASAIIAVSSSIAKNLGDNAGIPAQRVTTIPNAINLEEFTPDGTCKTNRRGQLNLENHHIALGYVGRLHPNKGVDLLIDIMDILLKQNPNFRLVIIGDGPLAPVIQQQIQSKNLAHAVRLLGFQSNVRQWLNAFDMALVPSRQEPFGIVLLEWMAMGVPIVCSGVDGMADFVTHEKNVLAVDRHQSSDYADAIIRLIKTPQLKQTLIENARRTAQHYSAQMQADKIYQLYRKITHAPTRADA